MPQNKILSLDDEILFLKIVVLPSFAPTLLDGLAGETRLEWMKRMTERFWEDNTVGMFLLLWSSGIASAEQANQVLLEKQEILLEQRHLEMEVQRERERRQEKRERKRRKHEQRQRELELEREQKQREHEQRQRELELEREQKQREHEQRQQELELERERLRLESQRLMIAQQQPQETSNVSEMCADISCVKKILHNMQITMHCVQESMPKARELVITPSEYKKSQHGYTFQDIMSVCTFPLTSISKIVEHYRGPCSERGKELDFSFPWESKQLESESYLPLQAHLECHQIFTKIVADGQDLPDKILYNAELWTLRKNTLQRTDPSLPSGCSLSLKYTIRGRTDLVRMRHADDFITSCTMKYFIEVKRKEDFKEEEALREAVLQLLGGNISNSFHSPPVLLTNLASRHYVLFITLEKNPEIDLKYKLNVVRMDSFGAALEFVEAKTAEMISHTKDLGRHPTPNTSPHKMALSSIEEEGDLAEEFDNVQVEEVVIDENGSIL